MTCKQCPKHSSLSQGVVRIVHQALLFSLFSFSLQPSDQSTCRHHTLDITSGTSWLPSESLSREIGQHLVITLFLIPFSSVCSTFQGAGQPEDVQSPRKEVPWDPLLSTSHLRPFPAGQDHLGQGQSLSTSSLPLAEPDVADLGPGLTRGPATWRCKRNRWPDPRKRVSGRTHRFWLPGGGPFARGQCS
jgi:hypothetical protein